jgi:type II secretory pathway pseudopilin PulG
MKLGSFQHRVGSRRRHQRGYMLIVVTAMAAMLIIALAAAAPAIATQIKRDREEELVHRGAQYARAIKKFYKKTGRYPTRIEELQNTNMVRFLRKKYKDPITGEDFKLLRAGDPKLAQALGAARSVGAGATAASTLTAGTQQPGSIGTSAGSISQPLSQSGETFGGGPVVGVSSKSNKRSLKVFNDKDHYDDWVFVYDPGSDRGGLITGPYTGSNGAIAGVANPATPGAVQPGLTGNPLQGGIGGNPVSGGAMTPSNPQQIGPK